jgi:vitamin B12 transporter
MNKPFCAVSVLFALHAATSDLICQDRDSSQRLETVVVSATKVAVPASSLTQAVTVISGDDLRARGVTRVSEALSEVPGAALVQNGSYGAVTSLFLRGGESRYTKVLVDGVPVNAAGGFFDFSHLTTDNIDRIEIVRGPASVLYGADAVSGVVQIFTRRAGAKSHGSVAFRAGTYASRDVQAEGSGGAGPFSMSFGAGHHSTDGTLPFNNEYTNGTVSSDLSLTPGAVGEARVTARYTAAEFHYPTDYTGQPVDSNSYRTQHRLTVGLDLLRNFNAVVQARIIGGSNDVSDLTEDIAVPFGSNTAEHSAFRSRGYRRNAEARLSLFLGAAATVTVGAGYDREHENSSNEAGAVGDPTTPSDSFNAARHDVSYYSEILGSPTRRFSYTISGRVDDNSDYDHFATYRLGTSVELFPSVKARASLSTAFNAPAFNQLRPTLFTVGSPDLRPEQVRAAEVGLRAATPSGRIAVGAGYFAQRFADLIQYVAGAPPDFRGSYANLTAATSNGYEIELELTPVSGVRALASYTIVNPKVTEVPAGYQGGQNVGDALIRRPTHSGQSVVSYFTPAGTSLSAALNFTGKRADIDFAQFPSPHVALPAHMTLDLSGDYPLRRFGRGELTINARLANVFNARYEDVLHFPAPGRVLLVGARANALF